MLDTETNQHGTTVASLIRDTRQAKQMTLEQMGAELGVTKSMVNQWEDGLKAPDRVRVAAWIADDRSWVRVLGLQIFGQQYRALIQNVLVPA